MRNSNYHWIWIVPLISFIFILLFTGDITYYRLYKENIEGQYYESSYEEVVYFINSISKDKKVISMNEIESKEYNKFTFNRFIINIEGTNILLNYFDYLKYKRYLNKSTKKLEYRAVKVNSLGGME